MSRRQRYTLLPILVAMAVASTLHAQDAQPVYRATWTIQDYAYGLRQEFARSIIANANDWLTRDNASAPTARLDDRVHVTVVGEMLPPTGLIRTRLARLVLGTIVIDGSFEEFLDTTTISSIIRRDHFWRDENFVTFNQNLAPAYVTRASDQDADAVDPMAVEPSLPRAVIGIDRSSYHLPDGNSIWAGIGYEESGLPDFTYGRIRAGIASDGMNLWAEAPLNVGGIDNPVLARGVSGAFGVGVSLDMEAFLASVVWTESQHHDEATDPAYIDRSALLLLRPLRGTAALIDGTFSVGIGAGYRRVSSATAGGDGAASIIHSDHHLDPVVRFTMRSEMNSSGDGEFLSAEIYGSSLIATWSQQVTPVIGYRISASVHGLYGDPHPFLPSRAFLISPFIMLW